MTDFDPKDWADWMRARHDMLKVGGTWGIPGPPPCVLQKTEKGWKVVTGEVDSRTRLVCKEAGLEITE
jgi:hypothetical protein